MNGLNFLNHNQLGFIPRNCWPTDAEFGVPNKGKHCSPDDSRGGYLQERRQIAAITPEDELIEREEITRKFNEKKWFVSATTKLGKILGFSRSDHKKFGCLIEVMENYVRCGMDGVIENLLLSSPYPQVAEAVLEFAKRIAEYDPEISVSAERDLAKRARRRAEKDPKNQFVQVCFVLFGAAKSKRLIGNGNRF